MGWLANNGEYVEDPGPLIFDAFLGRRDIWRPLQGAHVRQPEGDKTYLVTSDGLAEVGTGFVHTYPTSANGWEVVTLHESPL